MWQARSAVRQQRCSGGAVRCALLVALVLWPCPAAGPAGAQEWLYTVRPGDSLWLLSNRWLTDAGLLPELQRLNAGDDGPWSAAQTVEVEEGGSLWRFAPLALVPIVLLVLLL